MNKTDKIFAVVIAILVGLLLFVWGIKASYWSISVHCTEDGYFIQNHQKYECRPTGSWIENYDE